MLFQKLESIYGYFSHKFTIMDNNWVKILVFSILSIVLGFILGRVTSPSHGCDMSECERRGNHDGQQMHNEHKILWKSDDGKERVIEVENGEVKMEGEFEIGGGKRQIRSVIKGIEDSEFEGDSTFHIGKAKVELSRKNGEMNVNVTMEKED
jgi:hypothetical protein